MPSMLIFFPVAGLFVIVAALERAGLLSAGLAGFNALAAHAGQATPMAHAILVGVDLGPNLSVTGSLATILWLIAIRRDGVEITAWEFLKVGVVVMPLALATSLIVLR